MYDHNVFAVLIAVDNENQPRSAFNLPENARWLPKGVEGVAQVPIIDSRQPNLATDSSPMDLNQPFDATDRLILTFDELLKDLSSGVQLGTNPRSSHVLLGHRKTRGVNAIRYNIIVADDLRIWLRDYSTHGTAVGYDGQNETECRFREKWILSLPPGCDNPFKRVTIISGGFKIWIMFPNHQAADTRYLENLQKLVDSKSEAIPLPDGLGLHSIPATATRRQAQTLSESAIYFEERSLGSGALGEIMKAIRTRDGKFVAIKKFKSWTNKGRRDEHDAAWLQTVRNDFLILESKPHVCMP